MKAIKYFTMAVALLVTGCNKPSPAPVPGPEQYDRYIFFSQKVDTKAELIESAASIDQFGVVGFKYDSSRSWNEYKAGATPNVFYGEDGELVNAETVDCDEHGYGEYSPLQGWSNTKKYTFFAYYPLNDRTTLVNTDGTAYTGGIPAIRYEMNADNLKGSMRDVMTAASTPDLYWNSTSDNNVANGEVAFNFTHRLSCLGLKITNASDGDITINSVNIDLSGIRYHQILIPLDGAAVSKTASTSDAADLSIVRTDDETWRITSSQSAELHDKLIFIPQTDLASFIITIEYTREAYDGYQAYTDSFTTIPLISALDEGKKHLVGIKFTDSKVEVTAPKAGDWVEIPPVNDTFN